ncbi:ABC transporter substrate-binding protein [Massilia sp. TSP1-1-2]|uniref:ABC transporter substrate-binding protein n=1 Tax=unclassified Massilia TaxID=2609279 RepID=UPI003CF686E6
MALAILRTALAAAAVMLVGGVQAQELVRLGNLGMSHFGALSYIKEIAPKCGIRVDEKSYAQGAELMAAIVAGELDVGATASSTAIVGRTRGAPIFVVAGFAKGGLRLVARPGQHIRNLQGLKGKKVGVAQGGIEEVLLAASLQDAGMATGSAPGRDVQLVYLAPDALNQALASKKIDAMLQAEPQASQAIIKGEGVEVLRPYETPVGEPVRVLFMTEAFYHRKRALAEKFMHCFVEATRHFIADPALAERYARSELFHGQLSRAEFREASANFPYALDVSARHIQVTTDTMLRTGLAPAGKLPLAREWVRTDLLEAAKKSLAVK